MLGGKDSGGSTDLGARHENATAYGSSRVCTGASVCRNDINPINVEVRNHL